MNSGWILDAYPVSQGMCVWIMETSGRCYPLLDEWFPRFYAEPRNDSLKPDFFSSFLAPFGCPFEVKIQQKKDFFTHEARSVLEIRVGNPLAFHSVVERLAKHPEWRLFNADMNLAQYYFYEKGTFPLAFGEFETDQGRLRAFHLLEDQWKLDYEVPPFRYAHLRVEGAGESDHSAVWVDPTHRRRGRFLLTLGSQPGKGTTYRMDSSAEDMLQSLNRHIADWDPDILLTDGGDGYILPQLGLHSDRTGVPVLLSRDPSKQMASSASHSFFSYGKMIYRAGTRTLFGRLHIDCRNSFMVGHTGLDGLWEIARVSKIPVQRASRCTIGTSLSSMQHEWAIRHNCLIPLDKGQTENFRPADDLIAADRGGLVYEPTPGWYEDLVELDFSSMYPEIMIRHNISPEAVNCVCCADNKVPEINHHLCRKRGMVPDVLEPIVTKRKKYKELIRAGHPQKIAFKARYDAFKWALVTCFGYLGFRNARFGKIEAHECVNAYSREALLKAKEVVEAEGFRFIHAIVDSLWLEKPGATDEEVKALLGKIEQATGLPIGLEGRYRWIRFCSSKRNEKQGVPTRYFGVFSNGEIKVRGIEIRRHDTPKFLKRLQQDLLDAMSPARNLAELKELKPSLQNVVDEHRDALRCGRVAADELALNLHLSREPGEYVNDTLSAIAAKKMAAAGIELHAGEAVPYVVAEEHDKVKDWRVTPLAFIEDSFEYDLAYYERLMDRAIDTIAPFPLRSDQHEKTERIDIGEPDLFGYVARKRR